MKYFNKSTILFELCLVLLSAVAHSQLLNRSCSYQIDGNVRSEDCLIYNLSGCPTDIWPQEIGSNGSKSSFPIDINISSYVYNGSLIAMSAVNVTFAVKDDKVAGFAVRFLKGCAERLPICRYYDFHSVDHSLIMKSVFFNDDVFFDVKYTNNDCDVEFVAVSNDRRSLGFKQVTFKVPDRGKINNVTSWQSLIVIDKTSYFDSAVNISFTTAPKYANVQSYVFQLVDSRYGPVSSPCVVFNSTNRVVNVRTYHVQDGLQYFVRVAPVVDSCTRSCDGRCFFTESTRFNFISYNLRKFEFWKDPHSILLCSVILFLIVIIAISLLMAWRQRLRTVQFESTLSVLIVYSHDTENHKTVVEAMATFLKKHCACKVLFNKWDIKNKDPQAWLDKWIIEADYILIVWSQGAQLIMSEDNTKVLNNEPGYLGDFFGLAMFKINAAIAEELKKPRKRQNLIKFCHVVLPYVSPDTVAPGLRSLSTFKLPSQLNHMLCHLHRVKPISFLPFPKTYPLFSVSDLALSVEGVHLLKSIDLMKQEVSTNRFDNTLVDYRDKSVTHNLNFPMQVPECHESKSDVNVSHDDALNYDIDTPMVNCNFHVEDLPIFGGENSTTNVTYFLHPNDHFNDEEMSGSRHPLVNIADCV